MRRENIIRIIPKRFQCGLRVFHSILDCNHSLASFATVLFLWFCDAARDAHTQCEAAFAFLHDTRAAISLWTAHWTLSVRVFSSACILYSLKSFFFLAFVFHFFCCCCCRFALHDFLDLLLYLSVVSSFPLPFRCVCVCLYVLSNSIQSWFACLPHPFHRCADMHLYKCARLRRYYKIAYIMSSFVTRHTRAQLTTENVVFDKVLLLLVLFGVRCSKREKCAERESALYSDGGVWNSIAFFPIVGARSLVRLFAFSRFSRFSCFPFFFIVASPFWSSVSLFPHFLCSTLTLTLSSSHFSYFFIYPLMVSCRNAKNESPDTCVFIRMYNVLGSAIITIIQLCGLCRLFVHSYATAVAVVTIAWANIHQQPSKLCRRFLLLSLLMVPVLLPLLLLLILRLCVLFSTFFSSFFLLWCVLSVFFP